MNITSSGSPDLHTQRGHHGWMLGPLEVGERSSMNRGPPRCCYQGEIGLHGWMDLMALRLWMETSGFTLAFGKQNGTVHRHPGTCREPCLTSGLLPLYPGLLAHLHSFRCDFAFVNCFCPCLFYNIILPGAALVGVRHRAMPGTFISQGKKVWAENISHLCV